MVQVLRSIKRGSALGLMLSVCVLGSLAGCHGRKPVAPADTAVAQTPTGANTQGTRLSNDSGTRAIGQNVVGNANSNNSQLLAVYFAYDSSEVSPEYNDLLDGLAKRLLSNKSAKLRLEGNTDERGSAEYNIGLGERRAQSVKHALNARGVTDAQLSTVSYGAERPQADGHDENAWSKNRRVDLVDVKP
jgi:peptidoglycan-associated lipoprotein